MPGQGTQAFGINDSGHIVGEYSDSMVNPHGFLLKGNSYTTIDDPNATPFFPEGANGINVSGRIVGAFDDINFVSYGYLRSGDQFTPINYPDAGSAPGQGTVPNGISDKGQIVGYYVDSSSTAHGFRLIDGTYAPLNDPSAGAGLLMGTYALGINNSGQVVGYYYDSTGAHGFLLSGGVYTNFDEPNGSSGTFASGINDGGQIVGYYLDSASEHGFIRSTDGQYTTLDYSPDPNLFLTQANGINDSGQIVGFYVDSSGPSMGVFHAFRATPDRGGHASFPTGHGGDRLSDIYTDEMTAATSVRRTINGDQAAPPSRSTGQGISGSVEIFFAGRLTANKHAAATRSDLFTSNDDVLA